MNDISKIQVPQNLLNFYKDLTTVQESQQPCTNVDISFMDLNKEFSEGNSVFRKGVLTFKGEDIKKTIASTIEVLARHRPELQEEAKKLSECFLKLTDEQIVKLIEEFILSKALPQSLKELTVVQELPKLVFLNATKPYLKAMAEGLKGLEELKHWQKNTCPICGWDHLLAKIEENGVRTLHCSLCDYDWQYKALKCVHCGNEDHEQLQIIKVTGVEGRELQVCEKCQGYVKHIKTKEVIVDKNLVLEDVKSLYLDLIAEKEGYKK